MRTFEVFLKVSASVWRASPVIVFYFRLDVIVNHVKRNADRDELDFEVGGFVSGIGEFVTWKRTQLKTGDEVLVEIIESDSPDEPKNGDPGIQKWNRNSRNSTSVRWQSDWGGH